MLRRLRQQFGDLPLKIGFDLPNALRLSAERIRPVQKRVVIELDERLQRNTETFAIIEHRAMVIRNPPRSRI